MKVTEFNYDLPEELIAQTPLEKRDESLSAQTPQAAQQT